MFESFDLFRKKINNLLGKINLVILHDILKTIILSQLGHFQLLIVNKIKVSSYWRLQLLTFSNLHKRKQACENQ